MSRILKKLQSNNNDDSSGSESIPLTYRTQLGSITDTDIPPKNKAVTAAKIIQYSWLGLIFDLVLVVVPLVFFGLLVAAASQDKKVESIIGDRVQSALLLSPTIFPIVFAAICGKAMKSIALYKSQSGMSLRNLEHLAGTSSLFSALERVVILRNFGIVGIVTAVVWLLSPLGGQALSLRLLSKQHFYEHSTQNATYLGPSFLTYNMLDSASGAASFFSQVMATYSSSLLSSHQTRGSPRDVWGNPKTTVSVPEVPKIGDPQWTAISGANDTVKYNSFIGLPIKAFSGSTTSKFTVSSVYLEIQCSSLGLTDTETFKQSLKEPLAMNAAGGGTFPNGTTSIVFPQPYPSTGYVTTFLYATNRSMNQFYSDMTKPLTIFYGSRTWAVNLNSTAENGGTRISLATCTMLPRGLETGLACTGEVCHAVAARRIPVSVMIGSSITAIFRRGHFCGVGSSHHLNEASQTEHFLADGFIGDGLHFFRDLYQLPLAQFTERFQQAINTFWYASNSQAFSTGNFTSMSVRDYVLQTPALVTEDLGLHYSCNWTWFWLAVMVIVLLESLAVVNAVLRFRTKVPDIFGYVSSLTIDNRYCNGKDMEQSSALDGLQRARALGYVRFQLADVNSGDGVGKIAFVPRGVQDEIGTSRVRFNRFYN